MIMNNKSCNVVKLVALNAKVSKTKYLKFMLSKKVTKFNKIFTVNMRLCSKCQIDCEDLFNFCGLLRIHEL